MDFGGPVFCDPIVGCGVAVAFAGVRGADAFMLFRHASRAYEMVAV